MSSGYFKIEGETPSKKNSRVFNTKTHRSFPSKNYSKWHQSASEQIMLQRRGFTVKGACSVKLTFTHGDFIRRDSDNGVSSVFDLLTDLGIWEDDNWKVVRHFEVVNKYEKGKPCCEIEIEEVNYD